MDINITLFGQMLTFLVFVLFTMRYVWPPITEAIKAREEEIASGLAKGKQGEEDLRLAKEKAVEILKQAKEDASSLLDQAHLRSENLLKEAKNQAAEDAVRMLKASEDQVEQMVRKARDGLQEEVIQVSSALVEKVLKGLDESQQQALINKVIDQEGAS